MELSISHILLFSLSGVFLVLSGVYRKRPLGLFLLFLGAFCIRLAMGTLTEILNTWDEEYHAVVAKNMAENPLRPALYKYHVLPFSIGNWTGNEIWLHKPPFFLWVMALSIKVLGTSVLAVRLPSFIASSFTAWAIGASGKQLGFAEAGWWGGLLWAINPYAIHLAAGLFPTDHNDVFFAATIALCFWLWTKYENQKSTRLALLIGLAAGLAILTKWLTGLWIFLPWGLRIVRDKNWGEFKTMALALTVTAVIVAPWYLFIFSAYPVEAAFEMAYNSRHLWEAVEGHAEPWYYHFGEVFWHYGILSGFLAVVGIPLAYGKRWEILASIALVFLFFTFAATKMSSFTLMLAAPVSVAIGYSITALMKLKRVPPWAWGGLIVAISIVHLNLPDRIHRHSPFSELRANRMQWSADFAEWNRGGDRSNYIVFNLPAGSERLFLFYTDAIGYSQPIPEGLDSHREIAIWKDGVIIPVEPELTDD